MDWKHVDGSLHYRFLLTKLISLRDCNSQITVYSLRYFFCLFVCFFPGRFTAWKLVNTHEILKAVSTFNPLGFQNNALFLTLLQKHLKISDFFHMFICVFYLSSGRKDTFFFFLKTSTNVEYRTRSMRKWKKSFQIACFCMLDTNDLFGLTVVGK